MYFKKETFSLLIMSAVTSAKIEQFDPINAPDEVLDKFIDLMVDFQAEISPDDPPVPRELIRKDIKMPHPHYHVSQFIAWNGNRIVGSGNIGWMKKNAPGYDKNKHVGFLNIRVHKDFRRRGIGMKLFQQLISVSKNAPDLSKLMGNSLNDAGNHFCEKIGGRKSNEGAENRLVLENANWDLIREWNTTGLKFAEKEGISLQFFEDCPEDIIEEYCNIYQETVNQQPLGEFDGEITVTPESRRIEEKRQKEKGLKWYTLISREKDSRISGLTEIFYHPSMPEKAFQNLTGVKQEYRGRGLGKLLKSHMLLWFTKKYPQVKVIVTANDITNDAMLSINTRMGFKKHLGTTTYIFNLEQLHRTVNAS